MAVPLFNPLLVSVPELQSDDAVICVAVNGPDDDKPAAVIIPLLDTPRDVITPLA